MNQRHEIEYIRNEVFAWAKSNLYGKKIKHSKIEQPIEINRTGIKHTLWKNYKDLELFQRNRANILLTKQLPEIISNSLLVCFEPDNRQRDCVLGIYLLENEATFENEKYLLRIIVKLTNEKAYFYDMSIKN